MKLSLVLLAYNKKHIHAHCQSEAAIFWYCWALLSMGCIYWYCFVMVTFYHHKQKIFLYFIYCINGMASDEIRDVLSILHTVQYSLIFISPPTLGFLLLSKRLGNGWERWNASFIKFNPGTNKMKSINQTEKCKAFFLFQKGNSKKRGKIFVLWVCNTEGLTPARVPGSAGYARNCRCQIGHYFPPPPSTFHWVSTSTPSALDISNLGHYKNILHGIYS